MKRPRTLSATFVDRVSRPGFYGDGRDSRVSPSGVRPVRANSTIWRRKAGGYGGLNFGMVDTSSPKGQVSTKSGQLQYADSGSWPKAA